MGRSSALLCTSPAPTSSWNALLTGDSLSSPVVGYQAKELNENANSFVVQTFLPVGVTKANVTLSTFLPKDGADGWDYYSDYLATLKTNGNLDKKYGYLSPYWAGQYYNEEDVGWYDYAVLEADPETIDAEKMDDVKIPFGTGFLIYTSKANVTLTFAGEVLEDEIALPLNENANTFIGNATPTTVKLNSLTATDGANGWDYYSDYLATLKTNGNLDKKYGYLSPYWAGQYYNEEDVGWYDYAVLEADPETIDAEKIDDTVVFNPGDAFLVYVSKAGIELLVPSPL